jgi:hypothetical protein
VVQLALRNPPAERAKPSLPDGIATTVVASKARDEQRLVSGQADSVEKELRHSAVPRRDRVVGWLKRRVEGDAHG